MALDSKDWLVRNEDNSSEYSNISTDKLLFQYPSIIVLECLKPLSTIFQLYRGGQFFIGGNRSTRGKTHTYRKYSSHNNESTTPRHERDWNSQL